MERRAGQLIGCAIARGSIRCHNLAPDVSMSETYRGVMPFLVWDALRVLLLLFFPMLSLSLVRLLF